MDISCNKHEFNSNKLQSLDYFNLYGFIGTGSHRAVCEVETAPMIFIGLLILQNLRERMEIIVSARVKCFDSKQSEF